VEDDEGNKVHVYAQSETTYGQAAGLFGINCGHYPIPFIPGFSRIRPPEQNEEENAKEYEQSQQQRALERKLRYEKRDLAVLKAQEASTEERYVRAAAKAPKKELTAREKLIARLKEKGIDLNTYAEVYRLDKNTTEERYIELLEGIDKE
jgi:hypothetical protein